MAKLRPLHGEFVYKRLREGTGYDLQNAMAGALGIQKATFNKLLHGNAEFETYAEQIAPKTTQKLLEPQQLMRRRIELIDSVNDLAALEEQDGVEIDPEMAELAREFLKANHYIDEDGVATENLDIRLLSAFFWTAAYIEITDHQA